MKKMKKIILLSISALFLSYSGKSQSIFNQSSSNPSGAITNTGIDTMTLIMPVSFTSVGVQPVISKASGTMAGTAYLYGSLDGVNYVLIDSLTLADASINTTIWTKANPVYNYWRVTVGGATTVLANATAIFVGKRANTTN